MLLLPGAGALGQPQLTSSLWLPGLEAPFKCGTQQACPTYSCTGWGPREGWGGPRSAPSAQGHRGPPITGGRKMCFSSFLSFLPCCCCPDTLPGCLPGVLWFLRTLERNRRGQGQREQGLSCQSPDVPGKVAFQSPACSGPGAGHSAATLTSARTPALPVPQLRLSYPSQGADAKKVAVRDGHF